MENPVQSLQRQFASRISRSESFGETAVEPSLSKLTFRPHGFPIFLFLVAPKGEPFVLVL